VVERHPDMKGLQRRGLGPRLAGGGGVQANGGGIGVGPRDRGHGLHQRRPLPRKPAARDGHPHLGAVEPGPGLGQLERQQPQPPGEGAAVQPRGVLSGSQALDGQGPVAAAQGRRGAGQKRVVTR